MPSQLLKTRARGQLIPTGEAGGKRVDTVITQGFNQQGRMRPLFCAPSVNPFYCGPRINENTAVRPS